MYLFLIMTLIMINFTISVTGFEDAITMEKWDFVNIYINSAKDVVRQGGKVIFQQEYENAPPDILKVISTMEDIRNWEKNVSEVISRIKKLKK